MYDGITADGMSTVAGFGGNGFNFLVGSLSGVNFFGWTSLSVDVMGLDFS